MRILLVALTAGLLSSNIAQADVFEVFEGLQPVSTYLSENLPAMNLGGDTCCTGTSCCTETCCKCPPAPTMIGDSLGIPFINTNGFGLYYHTNFYSRIADNNSAIPQNRVYFNYKFYNDYRAYKDIGANAPDANTDIQYYELGMEKTLFDGNVSAELILPFSYGPQSFVQATPGLQTNQAELQSLAFGLKALLIARKNTAVSAGFRIEAPTREPVERASMGNTSWARDVWTVTPYLATLITPTDDLFLQGFLAYRLQTDDTREAATAMRREPNYFQADAQLGYWLMRNTGGTGLTGLQAKTELHYTGAFEPYSPPTTFVGSYGEIDQLNLTTGLTALFNDNATLTTGMVFPVRDGSLVGPPTVRPFPSDRQFDWEFVMQFNLYFGN